MVCWKRAGRAARRLRLLRARGPCRTRPGGGGAGGSSRIARRKDCRQDSEGGSDGPRKNRGAGGGRGHPAAKSIDESQGMTLIELTVSLAIVAMLVAASLSIASKFVRSQAGLTGRDIAARLRRRSAR